MIGKFASRSLLQDGERSVLSVMTGLHFDAIEVRLTTSDFLSPKVQEWMAALTARVNDRRDFKMTITVEPDLPRWKSTRDERVRPEHRELEA